VKASIRQYKPGGSDQERINDICCDCAFLGEPIDSVFQGREWFSEFMISPYLTLEPEHTWVAEVGNKVVGYLTGAMHPHFGLYRAQLALMSVSRLMWEYLSGRYRDHPRSEQFARFVLTEALPQVPEHPGTAGHFHFNVAKDYRGRGLGSRMLKEFERALRAAGLRRYYAEVMSSGAEQEAHFKRLGYRIHGDPIPTTVFASEVPEMRVMCIVKELP
jgi:ribosomal protein S18 acetylase RimI-like enzyme